MFEFEFRQGSADKVVKELKSYQNHDGGFGHGLERWRGGHDSGRPANLGNSQAQLKERVIKRLWSGF